MNASRRVYAILGHPVAQVRSPALFNALFAERNIDATLIPLEVAPGDFGLALTGLRACGNVGGLIVTIPHKAAAAAAAHRLSERVVATGAANVLRPVESGWEADLLDGLGFIAGLVRSGHPVCGLRSSVVGAGGAGLAIADALLEQGGSVDIWDLDPARSEAAAATLAKRHGPRVRVGRPSSEHDLAVNATPIGMSGDPNLPFEPSDLSAHAIVADAVMEPAMTPLLGAASALGLAIVEGRRMLEGQVDLIWRFLDMGREGQA